MRHYFLVLLRTIRRERLYTAINIAGLSLGVACCLILGLFLRSELTYDQHNLKHRQIYRIVNEFTTSGTSDRYAFTSRAFAPMLAEEYPEIKAYVRFEGNSPNGGLAIRHNDQVFFWTNSYYVSPNVFEVFTHIILYGDPKTALRDSGSAAVSASFSKKYFGNENPIGQVVTNDAGHAYKINLVFADLPTNSHLKYDLLVSGNESRLNAMDSASTRRLLLLSISTYTYLLMEPSFKQSDWQRINDEFYTKYIAERAKAGNVQWRSWLQPLSEIHLRSGFVYDLPTGSRAYLYACTAVALIILVVACINYMNLATARATRRARSVGIRKILGANRIALGLQFLGEAMLFSLIALVFGIAIVEVVLTFTPINELLDQQVNLDLVRQPIMFARLVVLALVMGLLSGAYPAFYLSSWAPLTALTGKHLATKGDLRLREALVLLQFTVSAAAIACTLLMMVQMHYISNKPLGFEKENRIIVTLRGSSTIDKTPTIRNQLSKDSHVLGVAVARTILGQENVLMNVLSVEAEDGTSTNLVLNHFGIGESFEKIMGLNILQGRDLSLRLLTDVDMNLLVNESLVHKMGWANPLGKRIGFGGRSGRVIGVVQDFNFKSLRTQIEPVIIYSLNVDQAQIPESNRPFQQSLLVVNISGIDIGNTLAYIGRIMAVADPKHPFEYTFLDASLDALYKSESHLTELIAIFAAVSIFIACMGLFGLAAFTTEQRTREIGTRKVLGASTWQIITLLARHILLLVLIASTLAAVIAYFAIDEWLAGFAYRTNISPLIFVMTALAAAAIAFSTVALQSYKTASADPVKTLRHV